MNQPNPLQNYFRTVKLYMSLPSGTSYYASGVVEFTEKGEVGVMPMTGKDELAFKNPDSLLNGEALIEVLTSCVPSIKKPRELLTNDIDALITAIRYSTYNDSLETEMKCPECGHDNTFKLNLQYALDNMSYLEPEYIINLETGLSVYVKPYAFDDLLQSLHSQFEQTKLQRAVESSTLTDDQRSGIFGTAFREIATVKFNLMTNAIVKLVDESRGVNVSDKKNINEFLYNIDKKSIDKIHDLLTEINEIGIKRTFLAKCEKCEHQWESEIDFNPVNFS
jgi:hypothetical protein